MLDSKDRNVGFYRAAGALSEDNADLIRWAISGILTDLSEVREVSSNDMVEIFERALDSGDLDSIARTRILNDVFNQLVDILVERIN